MTDRRSLGPWPVLLTSGLIGLVGWGLFLGLLGAWPVTPERDWRALFFLAIWLAVGGTVLSLIWLLHRRFANPRAGETWSSYWVLVRQAAWVGTWVVVCAWMQMHRTLNWAMALLLVVVFVLLEAILYTRRAAEQEL